MTSTVFTTNPDINSVDASEIQIANEDLGSLYVVYM